MTMAWIIQQLAEVQEASDHHAHGRNLRKQRREHIADISFNLEASFNSKFHKPVHNAGENRHSTDISRANPWLFVSKSDALSSLPFSSEKPIPKRRRWDEQVKIRPANSVVSMTQTGKRLSQASQIAEGYQPAVLKVVSYGGGITRATAMASYVQREETQLETHDGRLLEDHEDVANEMRNWSDAFEKRKPSDDVMTVGLMVKGLKDNPQDRAKLAGAIQRAFSSHNHAYRIDADETGDISAQVVTAMAGMKSKVSVEADGSVDVDGNKAVETKQKVRFSLTNRLNQGPRLLSRSTQNELKSNGAGDGIEQKDILISLKSVSHAKAGVAWEISKLATKQGAVSSSGSPIKTDSDIKSAAALWSKSLRSQSPRDTMHLVLSAKSENDPKATLSAARAFLHDQFKDHKFVFALHTDKAKEAGHIHVHAIIAVRNGSGEKLVTGPDTFQSWREKYAHHAQCEGMRIAASTAMERASSQSYHSRDKSIVQVADNPRDGREEHDRSYARRNAQLIHHARHRIATARANPIRIPETDKQRNVVNESLGVWSKLAEQQPLNQIAAWTANRLTQATICGKVLFEMSRISNTFGRGKEMAEATADQMRDDLRALNSQIDKASDNLSGESKQQFMSRTAGVMETLALRTDLQRMKESGVTHIAPEEVQQLAGQSAARLIGRANEIADIEQREADNAREIADRAVEREHSDSGSGRIDPASIKEAATDREISRYAESVAQREKREADAARTVAREITQNPDEPIAAVNLEATRLEELAREQKEVREQASKTPQDDGEGPQKIKPARQRL